MCVWCYITRHPQGFLKKSSSSGPEGCRAQWSVCWCRGKGIRERRGQIIWRGKTDVASTITGGEIDIARGITRLWCCCSAAKVVFLLLVNWTLTCHQFPSGEDVIIDGRAVGVLNARDSYVKADVHAFAKIGLARGLQFLEMLRRSNWLTSTRTTKLKRHKLGQFAIRLSPAGIQFIVKATSNGDNAIFVSFYPRIHHSIF